jgi:hypothetical protein
MRLHGLNCAEQMAHGAGPPHTPDGRYFVVRGRLWRLSDPHLTDAKREALVSELMAARRALKGLGANAAERAKWRAAVERAKVGLGERGPVWWADGAPDFNRRLVKNTPYADWYAG